jgi:glucose/arabinose dehydrogenase
MRKLPLVLGLAALSIWSTARAQTLADGAPKDTFQFSTVASMLGQFTDFRFLPDGRIVLISKGGEVRVRKTDASVVNAGSFQVDTESEKGLLGVEVHPQFATNKTLFFYYSRADSIGGTDLDRHNIVSITLKDDNTLDMATQKVLVKDLRGPANHDGGGLALSGDGTKLFIGVGDTGCNRSPDPPNPPGNYFPTCLTNGNGKILRVNLDGSIPTDNPLFSETAVTACGASCGTAPSGTGAPRKDIWAWGFRNPWRMWTDPTTGMLWVGDVGESTREEITIANKGKHHGWPWREGTFGWPATKCTEFVPNVGNCVDPVHELNRSTTVKSITGGAIVDSCDWPASFRGLYYFADNATGAMWTVQPNGARDGVVAGSQKDFGSLGGAVSMRPGPDGALYVASIGGRLIKFEPKTKVVCEKPETGIPDTGTPDTGTPTSDSGVDDANVGDSGVTPGTDDDGGCGCELPGRGAAPRHGLGLLAFAGVIALRRRRAR